MSSAVELERAFACPRCGLPSHPPRPCLSIVLPAYNEEANVERAVRDALRAADEVVGGAEVVVVNDGSRDGTRAILQRLQRELGETLVVVDYQRNRGYGAALRSGFEAASGNLVFYTDADNQFDLTELRDFLPLLGECDAALGYRIDRQDPWLRLWVSRGFNALTSLVLGVRVRDLNCSFKLFRRDALLALGLETSDFLIDAEIVARLHRARLRVAERGVHHFPRTAGQSTVRASDMPRSLRSLFRMWARLRRHPPGR
jgi:glycosyltransferase involved in cell wall biosynthesis